MLWLSVDPAVVLVSAPSMRQVGSPLTPFDASLGLGKAMLVSLQAASAFPVVSYPARDVPSITHMRAPCFSVQFHLFTFDAKQKNRRREAKSRA